MELEKGVGRNPVDIYGSTFHSCVRRLRTRKQGCSVAWGHSCSVAWGPCGTAAWGPWCRLAWGLGGKPAGELGGTAAWAPGGTAPLALGGLLGGTAGEAPGCTPPWEFAQGCFCMTGGESAWGPGDTAAWGPGGTAAWAPAWLLGVGLCGKFCGIHNPHISPGTESRTGSHICGQNKSS